MGGGGRTKTLYLPVSRTTGVNCIAFAAANERECPLTCGSRGMNGLVVEAVCMYMYMYGEGGALAAGWRESRMGDIYIYEELINMNICFFLSFVCSFQISTSSSASHLHGSSDPSMIRLILILLFTRVHVQRSDERDLH